MEILKPTSEEQLREAVATAVTAGESFEITAGAGAVIGRPVQATRRLDLSGIAGIVTYQPEELVLTAKAGTPLAEIESALRRRGQFLAFEPPHLGALMGSPGSSASLGGIVATGLSGPRRLKMGAVRDHVLGVAAVSGHGESFVCGGKVIKNVTGYDVPKLLTGSHGTLAAMHEITLKTLPAPEDVRTLLILGLDDARAVSLMSDALRTPAEISGACHLPANLTVDGKPAGVAATALRLEGFLPSVDDRLGALRSRVASQGEHRVLDREASGELWGALRDVLPFVDSEERPIWRISVPPFEGAAVCARLVAALPGSRYWMDWGGGLIWLMLTDPGDACAQAVRAALGGDGHATLIRASQTVRAATEVFQPQPAAIAALTRRVKEQFDPVRVLNPGRMYLDL